MSSMHHGDMVFGVVSQDSTNETDSRAPIVQESWRRCLAQYNIDPQETHATHVLTAAEYRERAQRHEFLITTASSEMVNLRSQLGRAGYTVILTDAEGVVLQHYCDPGLQRDFQSAGLWQGADWSELTEGTNGIGTCITHRRPVTVHKDDHFRAVHTELSCSGSPIHDPFGDLLGVLDVSSVNRADTRESQQSVLSSVIMSARTIENAAFLNTFRDARILRFHIRREFVGLLNEGLLALDRDDRVLGANACALNALAVSQRDDIIGLHVAQLVDMGRLTGGGDGIIAEHLHGRLFHARLDTPPSPHRRRSTSIDLQEDFRALGSDRRILGAAAQALRIINAQIPLLLQGETGAGKEVFARTLHEVSANGGGRFIAVNCSSIPDSLIESELFGYVAGAFTGARREGMRGKIQQADGGTLFLDEIGDMPLHLQSKVLRVLENDELTPLGSDRSVKVNTQIISATNRDIVKLVEGGEFREDLYYRLNGLSVVLPPLRERDDIEELCRAILRANGVDIALAAGTLQVLLSYDWPGNIRQLRNVLRVALTLCDGNTLQPHDLPDEVSGKRLGSGGAEDNETTPGELALAERNALLSALTGNQWNVAATARQLGVSRNTMYRKIRRHDIKIGRDPQRA